MRDYKGWTGKERLASLRKTNAAIAAGIIPPATECNRCGKTTGSIEYHNPDYSDSIKYLEPLCKGCHIRLHRKENKNIDSETSSYKSSTQANKNKIEKAYYKINDIDTWDIAPWIAICLKMIWFVLITIAIIFYCSILALSAIIRAIFKL
jgi:hypothetical protein